MKKDKTRTYGIYTLLVIGGLLLGWLLFGRDSENHVDSGHNHDHTEMDETVNVEYTCSMHPQVRQDEPGECPICGMDLIPVSDGDDHQDDDPFLFTMQNSQSSWANVQTRKVEYSHSGTSLRLTGKVTVSEKEQRHITAHFPGRIEQLFADYTGQYIRQGEKLATLYSPELMQAQQELIQAAAEKETQPRLYKSAKERLKLFNLTEAQIDRIEESGQASSNTDVYASQSGYLARKSVSEGDYVSTGQTMFEIAGLNNVWVELDAYESQIGLIKAGDRANVHVTAYPGEDFGGRVEFIDPFLDNGTRSARVRLTVANRDNMLKPGMLVSAGLTSSGTHQPQLVIPSTALLWTGPGSVVYVKKSQQDGFNFEFREIETGAKTEEGYLVLAGLNEGEEIAVNGVFAIDAAAQLRGHYSMMAPPEKADIPDPFRSNLKLLFEIYFDLKNALADDDHETALEHGRRLHRQLKETGEHSLDGEYHMFWMERYGEINNSLEQFTEADNIEDMRVHFEPLSEAFIETAQTLGAIGQTWYVAYCPMVDGDRGAYWLSEFENIINPYFGSMMLRCGEVRETLREGVVEDDERETREMEGHVH
ncbi:MAG: efflux RND transporter periplasmic adaptor subunit [Bacteroidales bacterium]